MRLLNASSCFEISFCSALAGVCIGNLKNVESDIENLSDRAPVFPSKNINGCHFFCFKVIFKISYIDTLVSSKYRVKGRHNTRPIQAIPINRPTWSSDRNTWIVHKIIWINYKIIADIGNVCNTMIKIVILTNNTLFCGVSKGLSYNRIGIF